MENTLNNTNFKFEGLLELYQGKVRDVYIFEDKLVMIASDRISAFDTILPKTIPFKGQVLSQISWFFMQKAKDTVPVWATSMPHPNVSIGKKCKPFPVEMVIRGYLAGSAWRAYRAGQREMNGVKLPENLKENDPLPHPIITPSTKAPKGEHDEDISTEEILKQKLIKAEVYEKLLAYTKSLFEIGSQIADKQGLILADTKYEFGEYEKEVYLIDEIHTPDSSRYFDKEGFEERQRQGIPQAQRSKEMVRKWLMANGYQGIVGQKMPEMSDEWIKKISQEYINLYEQITGEKFVKINQKNLLQTVEDSIKQSIVLQ